MIAGMDTLAQDVLTYYFTHAGELSREKQFHLGNRLSTWCNDARANSLLASCRDWYVPSPITDETLQQSLAAAAQQAIAGMQHIVAFELRKPFFDRYPALITLEAELFHVRHMRELFDVDATAAFAARHPAAELQQLERGLLADPEALRALSTWAINFIYLYRRNFLHDEQGIDASALYEIGEQSNISEPEQLRLLIYLYTHCVIAESNFYARPLPTANLPVYTKMLARLETLLGGRLEETSLDTKLEFLVCCRLAGYQTKLNDAIYAECRESISPGGTFLVDTHNIFAGNAHKQMFEASEHRNVLFALSVLARA
jgi:hypothetical protein